MGEVIKVERITIRLSYNEKRYLKRRAKLESRSLSYILQSMITEDMVRRRNQ